MRPAFFLFLLAACGPKPLPKGPPPEYEDPPAPSWLNDAGVPTPAPVTTDPAS